MEISEQEVVNDVQSMYRGLDLNSDPNIYLKGLRKTTDKLTQDSCFQSRNVNLGSSERGAERLISQQIRSVISCKVMPL
jgi:hypothetical protein